MATQYEVIPRIFKTADSLVLFVFSAAEVQYRFKAEPQVTAEIITAWEEPRSVPDPRTVEFTANQPAPLTFIYPNGYTLDGSLSLRNGNQWIWGDFYYGENNEHHFVGTMAQVVAEIVLDS